MTSYIHFLIKTMRKKWSIIISFIVGLAIIFLLMRYSASSLGVSSVMQASLIVPFLFSSIFSVFVVSHVFKDGEKDGSELLVVSKPIIRSKIIISKFITTIVIITIFHLFMFIALFFASNWARNASLSDKINFALSISLGGLIIQTLLFGIITLLTSTFGKIGTLVISIVIAVMIPVVSVIIGGLSTKTFTKTYSYNIERQNVLNKDSGNKEDLYTSKIKFSSEGPEYIYVSNKKLFDQEIDAKDNFKFKAYIDPWYQWSKIYTMFLNKTNEGYLGDKVSVTVPSDRVLDMKYSFPARSNNPNNPSTLSNSVAKFTKHQSEFAPIKPSDYQKNFNLSKDQISKISSLLVHRTNGLQKGDNNYGFIDTNYDAFHTYDKLNSILRDVISNQVIGHQIIPNLSKEYEIHNFYKAIIAKWQHDPNNKIKGQPLISHNEYTYNSSIKVQKQSNGSYTMNNLYKQKPYGNKTISLLMWIVITFIAIGASMSIYMKRDFK